MSVPSHIWDGTVAVPKILAFETSHEAHILGFGVPNAKYLAFSTPDENALKS